MPREFNVEGAQDCIAEEIGACAYCRPWDQEAGKAFWFGRHTDIGELLEDCGVDEDHWAAVLDGLACPSCGTEFTDICCEVELKSESEKKVEELLDNACSSELVAELHEFHEFLTQYPYLGLDDPKGMGSKIRKAVGQWQAATDLPGTWYRARRLNDENRIFESQEMCAPDPKKVYVREGRFNHAAQSVLYLASYPETAFKEIRFRKENICAMQEFALKESIKVLDLRQDYVNLDPETDLLAVAIVYNGFIDRETSGPGSPWKPEHFIPRFIADCAHLHGYDGILFGSTVSYGDNLAVFPDKKHVFEPKGKCERFPFKEVETPF